MRQPPLPPAVTGDPSTEGHLIPMRPRIHLRPLILLAVALLIAAAAAVAGLTAPHAAQASSTTTANPWTMQMTDGTQDGLVVRGTTGTSNPFLVFDRLGQPIFGVGEAGGAKVYGDDLSVYAGSDIFHADTTISPNTPNPAVCVRPDQMWIGHGHIWHCEDIDGSGPSPLAWWQWL